MSQRKATALLLLASVMWGSSFVASKVCLNSGMLQFEIVFYRFFIGAVLMGILFRKELRKIPAKTWKAGIVLGLVTTASFTLEMYGITMTQTTKAAFITATSVVMMPFLYWLVCHVKPGLRSVCAALIALTGVGFLSLTGGSYVMETGDVLLLFAAVLYDVYGLVTVTIGRESEVAQMTFLQFASTAAFMGLLTLFQGSGGSFTAESVGAVVYLAVMPTVVCYMIKNVTIRYMSPVRCSLVLSTESVFCAILSAFILKERITLRMLFGIILIFGGVLMEQLRPRQDTHTEAEESTPSGNEIPAGEADAQR